MYIDEAGVENTLTYDYGWSPNGTPIYAERLGHFTERVSMVAAWCVGNVFAPILPVTVTAVWSRPGSLGCSCPNSAPVRRSFSITPRFTARLNLRRYSSPSVAIFSPYRLTPPTSTRLNTYGIGSSRISVITMTST